MNKKVKKIKKNNQKKSNLNNQKSKNNFIKIDKDIWPLEKNVLFCSNRLKYVRKIIKFNGCVFCKIKKQGINYKNLLLFKNNNIMVIINRFPYNSGHILILPTRHCKDYTNLSETELFDLCRIKQFCLKIIKKVYKCDGFNVGMNLGEVAGAGIPNHLHCHIIPRWEHDTNFFPLVAQTKTVIEDPETTFLNLIDHFKKIHLKKIQLEGK